LPPRSQWHSLQWCRPRRRSARRLQFASRETFIIDPHGKIVKQYAQVDPHGHAQVVLKDLQALQQAGF
jgi:peroxiredoxin